MRNQRLQAALLEHGLTPSMLADRVGVDHKTVERWISGRVPYRRLRYAVAAQIGVDESYLWPGALSREQVSAASDSEVVAIYPHRSDVPLEAWRRLFSVAEREIGVLVYAGLFVSEDAVLRRIFVEKARAGVRVECCLAIRRVSRSPPAARMKAWMTRWPRRSATRWRCTGRCCVLTGTHGQGRRRGRARRLR